MSAIRVSRRDFLKVSATVAASAVLGACTPASPSPAPTTAATSGPVATAAPTAAPEVVNLEFWNGDPVDYQLGYNLITDAWNAANPGIQVEVKNAPGGGLDDKLAIMIAGGVGPDVWMAIPTPSQARLGHFADLSGYLSGDGIDPASTWFEVAWKPRQWEGKTYMVPRDVGWAAMAYNKDIFDELGVAYPTDDWTVEQFLETALATTDEAKGYWGTNFSGAGTLLWFGSIGFNMGFQANSVDGRQCQGLLDSPESIAAIQFMLDLEDVHHVAPTAAAVEALGNGFLSGKVAIGDTSTWGLKDQREAPFNWGLVQQPSMEGRQEYSWGGAPQFIMWSGAEKKDQIWQFMKYASTDGSRLPHEAGQWQSPMPAVWEAVGDNQDPILNFYLEYAKLPTDSPPYEREQFWESVGTPYFDIWTRYLENEERPLGDIVADAAATAQSALDDAFATS